MPGIVSVLLLIAMFLPSIILFMTRIDDKAFSKVKRQVEDLQFTNTDIDVSTKPIISHNNIPISILLSVLSLGIYSMFWQYSLIKNVKILKDDNSSCIGEWLLYYFVPFYFFYWWYSRGRSVREESEKRGFNVTSSGGLLLVLWIFGLGIVATIIMQNDFNRIAKQ